MERNLDEANPGPSIVDFLQIKLEAEDDDEYGKCLAETRQSVGSRNSNGYRYPRLEETELDDLESDEENCDTDTDFIVSEHESESEQEENTDVVPEDDGRTRVPSNGVEAVLLDPSTDSSGSSRSSNHFYGKGSCAFIWAKSAPASILARIVSRQNTDAPGRKGQARALKECNPIDAWEVLFTEDIINRIVSETNNKLSEVRSAKPDLRVRAEYRDLDSVEMKAVFGLLFYASIFKSNGEELESLFAADGTGRDIFGATMSLERILVILACLRFDDKKMKRRRRTTDPTVAVSWVFDTFFHNCQMSYAISEYGCVDEILIPFGGSCKFKTHMPKKPTKWGIKVVVLVDAETNYCLNGFICAGKGTDGLGLSDEEKMLDVPTQAVIRVTKPIENSHRTVMADSWFSSVELVQELNKRNVTFLGMMKQNKVEIPPEFMPNGLRPVQSAVFGFIADMTLISYVPKSRKSVILISSLHRTGSIDHETKKPEAILLYEATKGTIGSFDKMCADYSTGLRTRRWQMAVFFAILNISSVNSFVIYNSFPDSNLQRFDFVKGLAYSLVYPQLVRRFNSDKIPRNLHLKIVEIIGHATPAQSFPRSGKRKRCSFCPRSKDKKTNSYCQRCAMPYCANCRAWLCCECGR